MFNIIEFYTGVTNLTICLPVTLAKAWHLSRTRKFEVERKHKEIKDNLLPNTNTKKNEENEVELYLDESPAVVQSTAKEMLTLEKEKPLQSLIIEFEDRIIQQNVESKKLLLRPKTNEKSNSCNIVKNTTMTTSDFHCTNTPLVRSSPSVSFVEDKIDHKRLSVAERVKDIEKQFGSTTEIIPNVVPQTEMKSSREPYKILSPQFQMLRQPSTKTKQELRELKALLKLQSKMFSSSTDRLDKIENNFENLSKLLMDQLESKEKSTEKQAKQRGRIKSLFAPNSTKSKRHRRSRYRTGLKNTSIFAICEKHK